MWKILFKNLGCLLEILILVSPKMISLVVDMWSHRVLVD